MLFRSSFEEVDARDISPEMSFLEMFDVVNDRLTAEGGEPIASTMTAVRGSAVPAR